MKAYIDVKVCDSSKVAGVVEAIKKLVLPDSLKIEAMDLVVAAETDLRLTVTADDLNRFQELVAEIGKIKTVIIAKLAVAVPV